MKIAFLPVCLAFALTSFSQEVITQTDITYGRATGWNNNMIDLKLDISYPSKAANLPLIVYVHGGGFKEGNKEHDRPFCERLAKQGFAVANVEYRVGFDTLSDYKAEVAKAAYRAQQDINAAMRYLVHNASEYPVSPSSVFIAGSSAGGIISLFTAYVDQQDWDQFAAPVSQILGPIDNSGNELKDKFKIEGVINLWGGIADTSLISKDEMSSTPVLLFHSKDDAIIPFRYSLYPQGRPHLLFGSGDIADHFKNNKACYELYYMSKANHGFGFSAGYLAAAIGDFIKKVSAGSCTSFETENSSGDINRSFFDFK